VSRCDGAVAARYPATPATTSTGRGSTIPTPKRSLMETPRFTVNTCARKPLTLAVAMVLWECQSSAISRNKSDDTSWGPVWDWATMTGLVCVAIQEPCTTIGKCHRHALQFGCLTSTNRRLFGPPYHRSRPRISDDWRFSGPGLMLSTIIRTGLMDWSLRQLWIFATTNNPR
jgi:hypothetical protein